MKKALFAISALLLLAGGYVAAAPHAGGPRYVEGELLVKYRSGFPAQQRALHMARVGAEEIRDFKGLGLHHVRLSPGMPVEEAVRAFSKNPNVEFAEPNYLIYAEADPDDPEYLLGNQWGLQKINAPSAWDITTGSAGVVIAVIDTGVDYDHPDLAENIWHNPGETCGNGTDDDGNGYVDDCIGWDFHNSDSDPMDDSSISHGTHVAGIAGASGNNARGIAGVMWNARLMPLKILDSNGNGEISLAVEAINYARRKGVHIANCSWGSIFPSPGPLSLRTAMEAAPETLFVCAAGNEALDTDSVPHYPSGFDSANILSVAATDNADNRQTNSNFGATTVDVGAPGADISGTSMVLRFAALSEGFDGGDLPATGWVSDGTWGLTIINSSSYQFSLADSPSGVYPPNADSIVNSPAVDLTGLKGCALSYRVLLDTEPLIDNLHVEITNTPSIEPWTTLSVYNGSTSGVFETQVEPLASWEGSGNVHVRFRLTSDGTDESDGAYIDNVKVLCFTPSVTKEYGLLSGTSMAAPHAAGVAGLMLANASAPVTPLEILKIKHRIIGTVDAAPDLAGKTVSGGRVNAYKALATDMATLPPVPPSNLRGTAASTSTVRLTWSDNSDSEDGFLIERRPASGAVYSPIAQPLSNAVSYLDTGLAAGGTYFYRILATNSTTGDSPWSNEARVTTQFPPTGDGGGGCFIATAAYGSYLAPEVKALRDFRDSRLLGSAPGRRLVSLYYRYSPPMAGYISGSPAMRRMARWALTPVVYGITHPLWAAALVACMVSAALYARRNTFKKYRWRRH